MVKSSKYIIISFYDFIFYLFIFNSLKILCNLFILIYSWKPLIRLNILLTIAVQDLLELVVVNQNSRVQLNLGNFCPKH